MIKNALNVFSHGSDLWTILVTFWHFNIDYTEEIAGYLAGVVNFMDKIFAAFYCWKMSFWMIIARIINNSETD